MGMSLFGASAATAATPVIDLTDSEESQLRVFFDTFDVDTATQDELIATFESGGRWDSLSSESAPTSVDERVINGIPWMVTEYADGSVAASGIGGSPTSAEKAELARGGLSTQGVNDCGYSAGKTGSFSNCNIYYWVGAVTSSFRADFTIRSGTDFITSARDSNFTAVGACSSSAPNPSIVRSIESGSSPAEAGFTASATMCVTGFTTTFPNYLRVGGNQATHYYQ
jgi:hypothetical protein